MSLRSIKPIVTGIDFGVRSDSLSLEHVSRLLGVSPTSGFEKGERYIGRQKKGAEIVNVERVRSFGVWHFCTSANLSSNNIEDHARSLIETMTPAKAGIEEFISDSECYVMMTIWVIGYTFELSCDTLAKLSSFAESVTFTCWDEDEADGD